MKNIFRENTPLHIALLLILIVVSPALLNTLSVRYDAYDEMWLYFRWLGSALREGYFGDYFPYIVSGYPIGANLQTGTYNILYLLFSYLFYDSVWSINLLYITIQYVFFFTAYCIARTYSLNKESAVYFGLSIVASGFLVGHTSHYSYHASALVFMLCFLGIRYAVKKKAVAAFLLCFFGTYHALTAGYPAILSFGAQVFFVYFIVVFIREKNSRTHLLLAVSGVCVGAVSGLPAILHFLNQLKFWDRAEGVSLEMVMSGSLPLKSLVNFIFPYFKPGFTHTIDPTMERFHLLGISFPLLIYFFYLVKKKIIKKKSFLGVSFILGCFFTLLALGNNFFIPIRRYLAEHIFLYRIGRFPAGEHRGFALFCFAIITAFAFQHLWLRMDDRKRKLLLILIFIDFFLTMMIPISLRIGEMNSELRGFVPSFKITYDSSEQHLLDAPRDCSTDEDIYNHQKHIAPSTFYWEGYANLKPARYYIDFTEMRWAICGGSKLWDLNAKSPFPYDLVHYSPSRIEFHLVNNQEKPLTLLWAETNDGFWKLQLNGKESDFVDVKAQLRAFTVPAGGSTIKMIYCGPLSGIWRSF